jgi:hypothetical protein
VRTLGGVAHGRLVAGLPQVLERPEHGRYVRVIMSKVASPEGYILSEMEVYGRGGPVAKPKPAPAPGRTSICSRVL